MSLPWEETQATFSSCPPEQQYHGKQACHAMLYSKSSAMLFGRIPMDHAIMMQMRFDGTLGFPGGYINNSEPRVEGLNRELEEEIGLKQSKNYLFTEEDYYGTWVHDYMATPLIDHFYVKEYKEEIFKKIERSTLEAQDWGGETMGVIRVPLSCYGSTSRIAPFGQFLCHKYVGNAREQLVRCAIDRDILVVNDARHAWEQMKELKRKQSEQEETNESR